MIRTFGIGARGELVAVLQGALELALGRRITGGADGGYGKYTAEAVIEFASRASGAVKAKLIGERAGHGQAGPALWTAAGVEWPERFARCLQLTAAFEGTGFAGACGPAETGDTAGVTFGIIGFTSYNGELQELLASALGLYLSECTFAATHTMTDAEWRRCQEVIHDENKRSFEAWALDLQGSVRKGVKDWLAALGELPWFRRLQMERAHKNYWKRAQAQAKALMGENATDRACALLFDIGVQNGGLKQQELDDLIWQFSRDPALMESDRMYAVTTKLIDRLRQAKRPAKIIEDVRSRKTCICKGQGKVHGEEFTVRAWAL